MATKFYLDNRRNKSGDNPIRVSVSLSNERLLTSTGFSIAEEKWDAEKQRVKRGCSNAKKQTHTIINKRLNEIVNVFLDVETRLQLGDTDKVDLKAIYNENFGKEPQTEVKEKSFFSCIDEFMAETGKKNSWTKAVYEKFSALKNHLQEFNPDIKFKDFSEDGLHKFVGYLHNVPVSGRKYKDRDTRVFGMRNSTIKNRVSFLKWFLRWAHEKGYTNETAYLTFKPKLAVPEKKVVFLNWDELMTIYNFPVPENKKYLERVRDVFCFCCFTSLRYSDVANLRRSDVFPDYISITTVKTNDSLIIDLNDYSKAILKRYQNETFPNDLALPVISNQRMNDYIKEVGELCEINEPTRITYYKGNKRYDETYPKYALMSTHTGRRTFISNAIMMGIPPQVIMRWTGHSDYKAMKPYIDIADKVKAEAMNKFNK